MDIGPIDFAILLVFAGAPLLLVLGIFWIGRHPGKGMRRTRKIHP